jgi:hypothetical protein
MMALKMTKKAQIIYQPTEDQNRSHRTISTEQTPLL